MRHLKMYLFALFATLAPACDDVEPDPTAAQTDEVDADLPLLGDLLISEGGDCKFRASSDLKHCSMICDSFQVTCNDADGGGDGIATCKVCGITGCSSWQTDGCDPDTWP